MTLDLGVNDVVIKFNVVVVGIGSSKLHDQTEYTFIINEIMENIFVGFPGD
ncbi:MAG: hypothetical protein ACSHWU_01740 [Marinicella sp.]